MKKCYRSIILWIISVLLTLLCMTYHDKTGPTYPLRGEIKTIDGLVSFTFSRSEYIGTRLKLMVKDPVPEDTRAYVKYRRLKSHDDWHYQYFEETSYEIKRRGRTKTIQGMGAALPSLEKKAGKYEFFVFLVDSEGNEKSITGEKPIYARYKAFVPHIVLLLHVLTIFLSFVFAIRTTLEAFVNGKYIWMMWATIISFIIGGFILGPAVQLYAFGVLWSGFPFGYDWTDNKVVIELIFWIIAAIFNTGKRRSRRLIYLAGIVTLIIYFIPHSIFGSEYNYVAGSGHGTTG